jgi:hypothetical protein
MVHDCSHVPVAFAMGLMPVPLLKLRVTGLSEIGRTDASAGAEGAGMSSSPPAIQQNEH